jgi:iron complex outermembrane receptor protein
VTQADASVSGSLFALPAGTVKAAVGVDYRKEKYRFNGDVREVTARPVIIAAPFDDQNALGGVSREIKAAYAEVLIPILDSLEVTVAGRIDDYGDFGTTTNPLVNFKFRPIEALMFRGNYNTAFRVPAFNQLFNGVTESLYTGSDLADPLTCPGGRPDTNRPGCENLVRSIDILNGGNLELGPETADMYSLGVVFEPSRNFSASADFFSIKREGTIQTLTLRQLVDNFTLFPERFIRAPGTNTLTDIDQRFINAGGSTTEGVEIVVRGGLDVLDGRFTAGLDGTYLTKKTEQVVPGGATQDRRGVFTFSGDLGLKWKHNAFISYSNDDFNVTLTQIYRDGYMNQQLPGIANGSVTRPDVVAEVDEYILYNLSVAFTGIQGMRFTVGSRTCSTRTRRSRSAMTASPAAAAPGSRASPIRADAPSRSRPN